jgi:hypothetical protein
MNSAPTVRHNAAASRYEIAVEGHLALAEYMMDGGKQVFTHTLVPVELRGRGLAEALVRTALVDARTAGRKVVPACSYVVRFIEKNPEFAGLLA